MLCEMARTVDELAFVAPETPMMSPAFTIFWFAVAALSLSVPLSPALGYAMGLERISFTEEYMHKHKRQS